MRILLATLATLLALVHAELWFGDNGLRYTRSLGDDLHALQASNEADQLRNDRLAAELADLTDGTEVIEEWARQQRGMVRPGEWLVQYSTPAQH